MKKRAIALTAAGIILLGTASLQSAVGRYGRVVHEKNSLYHSIFVQQRGSIVTLMFGMQPAVDVQTQVDIRNPRRHMLEYTQMCFCGLLYCPNPKRVLVLGLGGGVVPREIRHYFPEAFVDVVEIDPEILKVATDYFGFSEDDSLKVHIDDGRMFVRKELRKTPRAEYDMVILDAFNSDYIPYHLMTREFLEQISELLSPNGVVVANVFYYNRLFEAEHATFLSVFGKCQAYFGSSSGNAMLVAIGSGGKELGKPEAVSKARELQKQHRFGFSLLAVANKLRADVLPSSSARVLTDDRAPVNRLRSQPLQGE